MHRRTAMKVQGGHVLRKNNWKLAKGDAYRVDQAAVRVVRRRPGAGHRHVMTVRDVERFLALLPEWDELSRDLHAIVLDEGRRDRLGRHVFGVVEVCAWNADLWWRLDAEGYAHERATLDRLGVPCEDDGEFVLCRFTESTARAFSLLDVLLHELGHHHDRVTTRSKQRAARGEPYAEAYARRHGERIFSDYVDAFGLD